MLCATKSRHFGGADFPPRCGGGFAAPTFLCPKEKSPRPVEKKCFSFGFLAWITNGRAGLPRERKRSGSRGKRTSSGMSERRRLRRCEGYGACEDAASLCSRPLGGWAWGIAVLSAAPAPSTAPIAARRRQGVSSETTAPATATLRQQGVDKSLIVLGAALVDISIIVHQSRAARHKPPIPSKSPANPTPALRGGGTVSVP